MTPFVKDLRRATPAWGKFHPQAYWSRADLTSKAIINACLTVNGNDTGRAIRVIAIWLLLPTDTGDFCCPLSDRIVDVVGEQSFSGIVEVSVANDTAGPNSRGAGEDRV
jgi:hypothetical protein